MSYKHKLVSDAREHAEAHSGDLIHSQELETSAYGCIKTCVA